MLEDPDELRRQVTTGRVDDGVEVGSVFGEEPGELLWPALWTVNGAGEDAKVEEQTGMKGAIMTAFQRDQRARRRQESGEGERAEMREEEKDCDPPSL